MDKKSYLQSRPTAELERLRTYAEETMRNVHEVLFRQGREEYADADRNYAAARDDRDMITSILDERSRPVRKQEVVRVIEEVPGYDDTWDPFHEEMPEHFALATAWAKRSAEQRTASQGEEGPLS